MATSVCPLALTELIPAEAFHLIRLLGKGGTGAVYAARHRGCDVALKVLREDLALSERERGRFLDEASRMRRVEHEGLVRLLGSGVLSDGRPYLCMPRLRGETLASRLERGPLPLDTAVAVFDTLAEAVAVLHRAGLIHRDIKPENVFLEDGPVPHPVLLDFGIARDVSESESTTTAAGQTRGTPAYMAPERFFGTVASVRTDVYELAVTLYAMLTARLPWDDVQSAATRLSPIPPAHVGVGLPPELVTVILRALSTRPEMRPESADSFADLVRRAATGAPLESGRTTAAIGVGSISAPATPAGSSIPPLMYDVHRARRRPRLAWAMGVGLVGVLAMFGAAVLAHPNRGTQALASEARVPSVNASQETAPSAPQPERQTIVPIPAPDAPPPAEKSRPAPAPAIAPAMAVSSAPRRLPPPPVTAAPTTTSPAESAARYYRDRK